MMKDVKRSWKAMVEIVAVIFFSANCQYAAHLSVSGYGQFSKPSFVNGMHQEPYINETYVFSAHVAENRWFIRYEHEHKLTKGDYVELGYDGRYIYAYQSLETWARDQLSVGNQIASNHFVGFIYQGKVPCLSLYHYAGIIWLSFASGEFFETNNTPEVTPAAIYGVGKNRLIDPLDNFTQRYVYRGPDAASCGPLEVLYIAKPEGIFYEGYTNTLFKCLATTNLNGLIIPLETTMSTYIPYRKPMQTDTNLLLIASYRITVTNFSVVMTNRHDYKPGFKGLTMVGDMRFAGNSEIGIKAVNYMSSKWLNEEEVRRLPQYKRQHAEIMKKQRHATTASLILVAFILIVALPFIVLGFKTFFKGAPKNHTSLNE